MSDIVTLTNNGCQAGRREDEMKVQTTETPAPMKHLYCSGDVPKHDRASMGFGT
jgi:hypothetical protein